MKRTIVVEGAGYRLRPVHINDAEFIIRLRLQDGYRNRYINTVSTEITEQEHWIQRYLSRDDDYYFVVENALTGLPEGLIGIYDINDGRAEWGRWVTEKGSLAAIESVDLLYKAAFLHLGLQEAYCRTVVQNATVVAFHDALPQQRRAILNRFVTLHGTEHDVVEHFVTERCYRETLRPILEDKANKIFARNFRSLVGSFHFHHIGVATSDLNKEYPLFRFLGYARESEIFEDSVQGIKGLFLHNDSMPRIELLENLPGSTTLGKWLESYTKLYHLAYTVGNIEQALATLLLRRAKIVSPMQQSTFFGKRICFVVLPNRLMLELIEI